jgi:hypothetical protein
LKLYYHSETGGQASDDHELVFSSKGYDSPVVLMFQGFMGPETIVLNGNKKESIISEREFFKNKYGLKQVISSDFLKKIEAETNNQSEDYHLLLGELIASDKPVYMFDSSWIAGDIPYALPVCVETDSVETDEPNGTPTNNKLSITYYPYDEG